MSRLSPLPTRRPGRWLGAIVVVIAMVIGLIGSGALVPVAAQTSTALVLRQVDSTTPSDSSLQFIYTGSADDAENPQLTENGAAVETRSSRPLPASTPIAVALVFDTAEAMDTSGALVAAKEAAKDWVRSRSDGRQTSEIFAVYTASDVGVQLQSFTSDAARIIGAIDRVAPPSTESARQKSALWAAMGLAAEALDDRPDHQPNIVVMTGTNDSVTPGATRSAANGAIRSVGAAVFAAELTGSGLDPAPINSLVKSAGGLVLSTEDGNAFGGLVDDVARTVETEQYELVFSSAADQGQVADLRLQVGEQTATASVVVGSTVSGVETLNPTVIEGTGGFSLLQNNFGLLLLILVVLVAVGLLAYGVIMLFVREDRLSSVLSPYDATTSSTSTDDDDDSGSSMARTAIMQRAVQITEQVATDRGVLVRVENALERANLPLRAAEGLLVYASGVVLLTVFALVLTGSIIIGLILGALAAIIPVAVVNYLAAKRRKQFMALLPDTLTLLSSTLRAGYSLMQGVEAVAQEVEEPMGLELRRVVTEARLGRPLEEALDGTAERMASADFAWAVMAIRIQREVGGNLSELLLTVAETMVQRERLRRDVASLTAEGRVSAFVLLALPIGIGAVMFVINPEYARRLIETGLGQIMLGLAAVSMLVGFLWMKKIVDIEI